MITHDIVKAKEIDHELTHTHKIKQGTAQAVATVNSKPQRII